MISVNVNEAKARLSEYLSEVEKGATVVVMRRNVPIAEIRPIAAQRVGPRPFGLAPGGPAELPEGFWEPLPEAIEQAFAGREGTG